MQFAVAEVEVAQSRATECKPKVAVEKLIKSPIETPTDQKKM